MVCSIKYIVGFPVSISVPIVRRTARLITPGENWHRQSRRSTCCQGFTNHLYPWIHLPSSHKKSTIKLVSYTSYRRKFGSQTSDKMDRWKSRGGKSQRREKKRRREKIREEKESEERRCRCAKEVEKSQIHYVFPMICGSGGSKSRLAKVASAEPSGQTRDEKLHAAVARSTCRSQKCYNTTDGARTSFQVKMHKHLMLAALWSWKSARCCGAKHVSKSKCVQKHHHVRSTFGSWHVEKVHAMLARSTFPKCTNHPMSAPLLDVQIVHLSKVSKTWWFCSSFKSVGRAWDILKRICKDPFSVASAVQETCSSEMLGGPGADFLRGVAFWSIRSSGLLRWFCVKGAALHMTWPHFFMAGAVL